MLFDCGNRKVPAANSPADLEVYERLLTGDKAGAGGMYRGDRDGHLPHQSTAGGCKLQARYGATRGDAGPAAETAASGLRQTLIFVLVLVLLTPARNYAVFKSGGAIYRAILE